MKITTLIPLQFNDLRPVPEEQLRQIIDNLVKQFGACTEEGRVVGHRPEPDRPGIARENFLKLSIEMDRKRLDEARAAVRQIGRILAQREMYFEVREYDGVQIIKAD
jgi:hypothetical protein